MRMHWMQTVEMELPLVKLTVEPLHIQRVIADVTRDLGYELLTAAEQADTITDFLHGRDVLVCLPTSSGKSLCFALLPKVVDVLKAAVGVKVSASKHTCCHLSSYQSNGRPSSPFFHNRNTNYSYKGT